MKASVPFSFLFIFLISICIPQNSSGQSESFNETVETVVDKLPKLKKSGGNFNKYISKNIHYPANAKLRGIEGDVWVAFVVTSAGVVKDVNVEKSVDSVLDQAVVNFVKQTGPWKAGEKNGEKVNTQMIVPVKFILNEDERNLAHQLEVFNILEAPPLFVLDNKLIEGFAEIEDYNVKSIRVIKGEKALALYGDKAKNGVVVISTKRGTPPIY